MLGDEDAAVADVAATSAVACTQLWLKEVYKQTELYLTSVQSPDYQYTCTGD